MMRAVGLTAVATVVLGTSACGGASAPALTIYSGEHPQLMQVLAAAFEQQTGITINLRSGDSVVLAQQLLQEGAATPADIFVAENSPELMLLQEHGAFASLPDKTLAQIPALYSSPTGNWLGIAARISCLAYRRDLLHGISPPNSILDLAQPQWAGKIAVAPADSDFVPIVAAVIASDGVPAAESWLQGLKRNAVTYQDIEGALAAVERGAEPLGIINNYYWYRLALEIGTSKMQSQIHYFAGHDAGNVENIAGAGVLGSSKNQSNALRFIDFLGSAQGQRLLAAGNDYEYPLRPGVTANPALPPLSALDPNFIGIARLGNDQVAANLLQKAGFT